MSHSATAMTAKATTASPRRRPRPCAAPAGPPPLERGGGGSRRVLRGRDRLRPRGGGGRARGGGAARRGGGERPRARGGHGPARDRGRLLVDPIGPERLGALPVRDGLVRAEGVRGHVARRGGGGLWLGLGLGRALVVVGLGLLEPRAAG